jgi:transcriptional regulator with XRE-family HTH domain
MALKRSVETVGRNIHRIAFDKRVTQKDLAEAAGIAEGVMSKIIHGDHTPSLRVSMAIANRLGCTLDDLVKE